VWAKGTRRDVGAGAPIFAYISLGVAVSGGSKYAQDKNEMEQHSNLQFIPRKKERKTNVVD